MQLGRFALLLFFVLNVGHPAAAQRWRTYTPKGAGFSVMTPGPLRRVPEFTGADGLAEEPSRSYRYEKFYAVVTKDPEETRYGVATVEGVLRTELLESGTYDSYLNYLGRIYLGDPDEDWYFRTATEVVVNGSKGLDHIHVDERSVMYPRYNRGRIFDDGVKSYVLIYRGSSAEELESREVMKFLNSFHLQRVARQLGRSR